MHPLQQKILSLAPDHKLKSLTLREIGDLIGEKHPQGVRHHLLQLERKGFLSKNWEIIKKGLNEGVSLISIPIYGAANCGVAEHFADDHIEGYLKVSPKVVRGQAVDYLIAIKADGHSMNRANINGKSIEDKDYVIVETKQTVPTNGDYVVSIYDGVANIKKFKQDKENKEIVLISESTQDFPPIIIHEEDLADYSIAGKVVQVIKQPSH